MYLSAKRVRGHDYHYILASQRGDNRHWKKVLLYLGRLDGLSHQQVRDKIEKVRALGDFALLHEFDALLIKLGYPAPPPSLGEYDLRT